MVPLKILWNDSIKKIMKAMLTIGLKNDRLIEEKLNKPVIWDKTPTVIMFYFLYCEIKLTNIRYILLLLVKLTGH